VRLVPGYDRRMMKTPELTEAAKSVLISTGTSRQGATPTHPMTAEVKAELEGLELIGRGGGLTRRGTIVRDQVNVIPF
jgi:hypothetical protein